jgi:hypothetical protein
MHARHPEAAKRNGAKGGQRTAHGYADGPSAWAKRMALARWHRLPFTYRRRSDASKDEWAAACIASRAPKAGPGGEGGGTPEPGPATARKLERPPRATNSGRPQQLELL